MAEEKNTNSANNEDYEMKYPEPTEAAPAQNPAPAAEPNTPAAAGPKQTFGIWPIIAILLVVLVLILGGLYVWGFVLSNQEEEDQTTEETAVSEETQPQPQIDETDTLQAELQNEDFEDLDAGLDAIDEEIEAESNATTTAE